MPRRLLWLALACLVLAPAAVGKRASNYAAVDRYAIQAPPAAERNLDELGAYLKKSGQSSEDRARAVYRWIAERIAYDTVSYFSDTYPDQSAEAVLRSRLSVCAGYANLFEALARRCGLEVEVVRGEIRRDPEDPTGQSNSGHAWNAVKLRGQWHLVDSTWGSGTVDFHTQSFKRKFNPYYFLVPPDQLIFSHIPDDKSWQLLPRARTQQEIEALPRVTPYYFRYDVRPAQQRGQLTADQGLRLKFRTAPGVRLSASVYRQETALEDNLALVQPDGKGWAVDVLFPQKGTYKVVVWGKDDPFSQSFDYVLDYKVEAKRASEQRFPTYSSDFLDHRVVVEYPRNFALKAKKKTSFSVLVPEATDVQVVSGNNWQPLEQQGQWFRGQIELARGEARLYAKFPANSKHRMLLAYRAD